MHRAGIAAALALAAAAPAEAATDALAAGIDRLAAQFRGEAEAGAIYAPAFLAEVPEERLRTLQREVAAAIGPFRRFELASRKGPHGALLTAIHEAGRATVDVAFDPASGRIVGLFITDLRRDADSVAAVVAELQALPGQVALLAEALPPRGAPVRVAAIDPDRPMAVASVYKLAILGALADEVALGRRRWSDVVPLGPPSPPASGLGRWPEGAPMTLHSLAALMVSASDNRAADTLMDLMGREAVEARLAKTGLAAADATLPLLTTREAFALKSPGNAALADRFLKAGEAEQRDLLAREAGRLTVGSVDLSALGSVPVAIDRIEWVMSPRNMADMMAVLAGSADPVVRGILALNPGIGEAAAGRWDWLGYKGGSEAGVFAMAFAVEKGDRRIVVTGAWNDPAALLDEGRFAGLMRRLIDALPR